MARVAARCRSPALRPLHRYYGFIRLLPTRSQRLRSPLAPSTSSVGCRFAPAAAHPVAAGLVRLCTGEPNPLSREEIRSSPRFLGNPYDNVPRARDSGGPATNSHLTLAPMRPSAGLMASAPPRSIVFGAESSRPAVSLCTLRLTGHPIPTQHALPACPLRLWPGGTCTHWTAFNGFTYLHQDPPLPSFAWRDSPDIAPNPLTTSDEGQ